MAENDDTKKPGDGLADVLGAYEALALLAHDAHGSADPVYVLLLFVNAQLRRVVDEADARGLLS
jgi:hypothetical protein